MDLYNTMTTKALIKMVQELKQEFSDNQMAFETKVTSLETKVTSLETEVEGLETKTTILEASVLDLEGELHLERAKTDCLNAEKKKISELMQTVAHLEADVAAHALNTGVSDIVILKSFPLTFSNVYRLFHSHMVLQSVEAHLFSN
jgi:exonuclease VII small subunit